MRFLILLGVICLSGPFFPTVGSSQQNSNPFGFAPSAPTMAVPFFGNPAKSDDVEAKSMSPPQWGDEFAPLPTDKRQPAPKNQFNGQRPNQLSSPVADPARQKKENGSFVQASSPTKPAPTNSLVWPSTTEQLSPENNTEWQSPTEATTQAPLPLSQQGTNYPPPGAPFPYSATSGSANQVPFDMGFRDGLSVPRETNLIDEGQVYDHENKHQQSQKLSEVLKTGRYFASAEWQILKPYFHNNTAFVSSSTASATSQAFNWGYNDAPVLKMGFESKKGPGAEIEYWQYDHNSKLANATSDGVTSVTSTLPHDGAAGFGILSATNTGESIQATHAIEVHSLGVSFFKEVKMTISRLAGSFGFRYVSVAQQGAASLLNGAQTEIGSLQHTTDLRVAGPRTKVEYYRPIGHTKLEALGIMGTSLLFGNRDQFVENTTSGDFFRTNADEFVAVFDIQTGVQYVHAFAENRSVFARLSYISQSWVGGGTAASIDDSFGFRGVGFTVGLNR